MKYDKKNVTGLDPVDFSAEVGEKRTELFVLRNSTGMEVCVCNYGALILSIMVPDANDRMENVVIGAGNIHDAVKLSREYYIGATIGPVAGRIIGGRIRVGCKDYQLEINSAPNTLHSGEHGFHNVVWDAVQTKRGCIELTYNYKDGEAGFPGNIKVRMTYTLTNDNGMIEFRNVEPPAMGTFVYQLDQIDTPYGYKTNTDKTYIAVTFNEVGTIIKVISFNLSSNKENNTNIVSEMFYRIFPYRLDDAPKFRRHWRPYPLEIITVCRANRRLRC